VSESTLDLPTPFTGAPRKKVRTLFCKIIFHGSVYPPIMGDSRASPGISYCITRNTIAIIFDVYVIDSRHSTLQFMHGLKTIFVSLLHNRRFVLNSDYSSSSVNLISKTDLMSLDVWCSLKVYSKERWLTYKNIFSIYSSKLRKAKSMIKSITSF
jgi:hypothetical protein